MSDITARLTAMQSLDVPVVGGRTLAYVYDAGIPEAEAVGKAAVAAYAGSNGLDPTAFPSLLQMENEVVGFALDMIEAPNSAVGTVTSGGTESVLLAVLGARQAHPSTKPNIVVPSTAHAAFHKAGEYFGVEVRVAPTGADHRADPAEMSKLVDGDTVLIVASAPSYAHGVVDPVQEIAELAIKHQTRMHVDACIGGFVLPFAAKIGRRVTPWTFDVPGVSSISLDLHKYAYAPKGTSLLLHRDAQLRRPQYFATAHWPGYTLVNPTLQSTKSGGPLAGAWAVLNTIGPAGYEKLTAHTFDGVDQILEMIAKHPDLRLVGQPDSTLICFETESSCDVFTIADLMHTRSWWVQPQLSYDGHPANLHLTLSAATDVASFIKDLEAAVADAVTQGPIGLDADVLAFVQALDPTALSDADFDGLLAAAGMVGGDGIGLPEEMAPINALLDAASPAMRESLLTVYMDRLLRPTRVGSAP